MSIDLQGGGVFLLDGGESLAELTEAPFASEDDFQALVARHPRLIAAALSEEGTSRWLLVAREQGIAETLDGSLRWSVDHLLLDGEGVPTLVEVKRSTDTRLRREVVGQMLDYAAGAAASWRASDLRGQVEATDPDALIGLLGPDAEPEVFWGRVESNLRAGRLRLVFLADRIPTELERIVEFLDAQMELCEVRAVELRRFSEPGGRSTLVTRPVGRTAMASTRGAGGTPGRQWDEASFLEDLAAKGGRLQAERMVWLISAFRARDLRLWFGRGIRAGSLIPIRDVPDGRRFYPLGFWSSGSVEVQFQHMQPPFDRTEMQEAFADRLEAIPGVSIPRDRLGKRPSFPLSLVVEQASAEELIATLDWCLERSVQEPTPPRSPDPG
ncbi:hypothetical protein [Miltoncostaea oceani]|uniref:hypothetical protein n=1 Tax=Miltoncostaea oceani TaxID=2843216 RepID=UPI001C3C21D1|nr:hypothetical protein [Miltoncostaea oceani]